METREVTFSVRGLTLRGVLHLPGRKSPPCVIASHGLLSSKDSEKYVKLCTWLSREGIAAVRFDFLGCGQSDGKLQDSTVTGRLEELATVIDFVRTDGGLGDIIGLMGSSLGGYITLFKAAEEKDVKAVATWATPYRLSRPAPDTEGVPQLGESFYKDLSSHDLISVLERVHHCLVIHGDMDELIPISHATLIYENVSEPKRLEIIKGADHRLTNPNDREIAYRLTAAWFREHLNR